MVAEGGVDGITEALGVIDAALFRMMQRELVLSGEVADLLLDVRTLLTSAVNIQLQKG